MVLSGVSFLRKNGSRILVRTGNHSTGELFAASLVILIALLN